MDIQQAREIHIEDITALENLLFDNAFGPGVIRQEIQVGYGVVILEKDAVVAYAIVRQAGLNDLLRLGVRPDKQGQGLGRKLLCHVLRVFGRPMMLTVRKNNEPAFQLYKKAGFKIVAGTDDAWIMRQ